MKAFLAFLGGFGLSLAIFGAGAGTAVYFIGFEPAHHRLGGQDMAQLWTATPRPVDAAAQTFERLPPADLPVTGTAQAAAAAAPASGAEEDAADVDRMITAALPAGSANAARSPENEALVEAHVDWCASRYRSYRPRDDSYTPYSGGRRPCVSPFSQGLGASPAAAVSAEVEADGYDEAPDVHRQPARGARFAELSPDHVDYCFSRYRSYRPDDNSYQPYDGGPRRQCQ